MKLLLDEHYSPAIPQQLRKGRHDVVAAIEMPELRHRDDADVLAWATKHRRAVVTENAADYLALHSDVLARGDRHWGIVLTSARRYPRSRAGIGRLVRALDTLLEQARGDNALVAAARWL